MNKKTMLTGCWSIEGISPDNGEKISVNGTVPGHVHTDLLNNNYIKDPFWRDNDKQCSWVEDWYWSYEKTFEFHKEEAFDKHYLDFEGVDTFSEIYLNGTLIGTTNNMFISYRFDVTDSILEGTNTILVKILPCGEFTKDKTYEKYNGCFSSDRVYLRRMQCTFSWDWVARFVSYGIWKNVYVTSVKTAEIDNLYIYTHSISDGFATEYIEIETTRYNDKISDIDVLIEDPDGNAVWNRKMHIYSDKIMLQADIRTPKLWWPAGYGEQPLYKLKTTITDENGLVVDTKETTFGIRTIKVVQLIDEEGSREEEQTKKVREWLKTRNCENDRNTDAGMGFCVYVNDARIFCRGGNWVPADPFPSRITEEKYDNLVRLAKDGNINMLRVWGGGIYENDAFWDACNKYGILVSQDFMMACGVYPYECDEFIEQLKEEAVYAVKKYRNHPSLAFWYGNNENGMADDFDDPTTTSRIFWDKAILPALEKYEKSRPFFPLSPFGGKKNISLTVGETHFASITEDFLNRDFKDYLECVNHTGRFMSEYAMFGAPNMESLLKFMTYKDILVNNMFEYHTKDNPYKPEGYPSLFEQNQIMADKFLGTWKTPEERVQKLEYTQYIVLRAAVEGARRNNFYCSGILFWMYNDCWPASGWSMVDYYQTPKAGFYGFMQAAKPVIVSLNRTDKDIEVYIVNDRLCPASGTMNFKVYSFDGEVLYSKQESFKIEKNTTEIVYKASLGELPELDKNVIVVCEIDGDFEKSRAYYYAEMPHEMPLKKANVTVEVNGNEIKLTTDNYARIVELYGDGVFSDNYFDLLPGETKVVTFSGEVKDEIRYTWLNK